MKGYVFVSNSTKPSSEEADNREIVKLDNFSRPCVKAALEMGYEVYLGINRNKPEELKCDLPIKFYDSHTYRSIYAIKDNYIAIRNLLRVIEENDIEVIHCNTPVGGMVGRLCGRIKNVKHVIYTVHGFHFYKGAPLFNRTILKWAEMVMAHWTDVIITINEEDYQAAKKFHLRGGHGKVYKIPGVGINVSEYRQVNVDCTELKKSLGLKDTDIICISMGDLIPRKNYESSIQAIAQCNNKNIQYLICGEGPEYEKLKRLSERIGIKEQIHFLGYRHDIKNLLHIADIFLFTSLQEGLPRSLMEAMATGLPVICSDIRGNVDLLKNEEGGFLVPAKDVKKIAEKIIFLIDNPAECKRMGRENLEKIKQFDISIVNDKIKQIYKDEL